ncbi:hypothetical protein AZI86_11275 [Bdellovibrio bacteriovorus]|uniref:Uncharacterized protein n=1 Tax=Bdellovibrio bacteriovorus TaxID=959 RepID=A0A150WLH0_BDEBC|nr:hypothetical protein [Bdellovibrio bacteriovorus]KYG64778.1 hypothetical protein AZI86_11275 [Bdellovibrio bacteriovorus]
MISKILAFFYLVITMVLSVTAFADNRDHWSAQIDSQEVVLQNGESKYIFSSALEFRAARDQVLLLSTGNGIFDSQWANGQKIIIPNAIFQRFLRLSKEAPLQAKMENIFESWTHEGDWVHLYVKKSLRQALKAQGAAPAVDLLWLGCVDSEHLCLGMNDTLSNPNLLSAEIPFEVAKTLKPEDLESFRMRTKDLTAFALAKAFQKAGMPNSLAQWNAVKLLSRRASLLREKNIFLSQVQNFQYGEVIRDGVLMKNPEGLEVDFTFDRLDAKIRDFISNRYEDVEGLAKYLLAHSPYVAYEYDKGLGGFSVGPGFMFRIKRKILKNPHSNSPANLYRINDSVDLIVTINVGYGKSLGPARAGIGVGPGYMRKYLFSSFASSKETASKSPWTLTKEMVMGASIDQLKRGQSFTVESGWTAGAVASGYLEIYKSSRVRPQANFGGSYRFLSRHYVYMEDENNALVGFGDSRGYDFSAQVFFRAVTRFAKLPVLTWSYSALAQKGGVYRVPMAELVKKGEVGKEADYHGKYAEVKYDADYINKYMHSNVWFFKTTKTRWDGFIDLKPESLNPSNLVDQRHRFYLLESSADSSKRFSLGNDPANEVCTTWAAFEADANNPQTRFFDGSFKLTCTHFYTEKRPLTLYALSQITSSLNMDLKSMQAGLLPKPEDDKQAELSWDVKMSWKDLSPLFAQGGNNTGWIKELESEILNLRKTSRENIKIDEEAHERFVFVMAIHQVLGQNTEEARAKAFFNWIAQSNSKDVILKFLLKKLKNTSVSLHVFRPHMKEHALVEQNFSYGEIPVTTAFQLIEEKNKWLGLN